MSNRPGRIKRLAATLLAGMLGVGILPVVLAETAAAAPPPPVDTTGWCANAPATEPFTDVTPTNVVPHYDNIVCLVFAGITTGTTPTTYSPEDPVTRQQMSTFIVRMGNLFVELAADGVTANPLPAGTDPYPFTDETPTEPAPVHKPNIAILHAASVVNGFTTAAECAPLAPPCFKPVASVARGQMAAFMNRLQEFVFGAGFPVPAEDFFDDDDGHPLEDDINAITGAGISNGLNDNRCPELGTTAPCYGPAEPTARKQMASFLIRFGARNFVDGNITEIPGDEPPPPTPIQITPQALAVNFQSSQACEVNNDGRHLYDVALDSDANPNVDLLIVPVHAVNIEDDGTIHFEDDNDDDRADVVDAVDPDANVNDVAVIEEINNVSVCDTYVDEQTTEDGSFTVEVDSTGPEWVYLLIWGDTNDDDRLTLNTDGTPAEDIGLSGGKIWTDLESEFETAGTTEIMFGGGQLADEFDLFVGVDGTILGGNPGFGVRFNYDDNDVFRIEGVVVTKAQFEAALSSGDRVFYNYNPDEAGVSEFNLEVDRGYACVPVSFFEPNCDPDFSDGMEVFPFNADGGPTANDVVIRLDTPFFNQADAEYLIQRRSLAGNDGICGTPDDAPGAWVDVTTLTLDTVAGEDPGDELEFVDLNVADGCYQYRNQVTDPNTGEVRNSDPTGTVIIPFVDLDDPVTINRIMRDDGSPNQLDTGDEISLLFAEQVLAEAGDVLQIEDGADGEFTNIVLGTGNDFTVRTRGAGGIFAQTEISITLTADPTVAGDVDGDNSNNDGVIDFTFIDFLFIDGATGITDTAGNDYNPDVLFEFIVVDDQGPFIVDDDSNEDATSFDIWFNEAVEPESAGDASNYQVDNDGTFGDLQGVNPVVSVTLSDDPDISFGPANDAWTRVTVRVTFPITPNTAVAQTVEDLLGNSGDFNTIASPYPLNPQGLIDLDQTNPAIPEDGGADTLSVELNEAPSNQNVTVDLGVFETGTDCTVPSTVATLSDTQLVFTPATDQPGGWNVEQFVTVTAVGDNIVNADENFDVCAFASSSDPAFDGAQSSVTYTALDDEFVDITASPDGGTLSVNEPNGTDTIDVTISGSDPSTGSVTITATSTTPANCSVAPASHVFTAEGETFTFTVTAIDDAVDNPADRPCNIDFTPVAGAPEFIAFGTVTVTGTTVDNEGTPTAPTITAASVLPDTNEIRVDFSENVTCPSGSAAGFEFDDASQAGHAGGGDDVNIVPDDVQTVDANTCDLQFSEDLDNQDFGNLGYNAGLVSAADQIIDTNDALTLASDPTTTAADITVPTILGILADGDPNLTYLVWSEPVTCASQGLTDYTMVVDAPDPFPGPRAVTSVGCFTPVGGLSYFTEIGYGGVDVDSNYTVTAVAGGINDQSSNTNPTTSGSLPP